MAKELTNRIVLDDEFLYEEYDLVESSRDPTGKIRTSLEVTLLVPEVDRTKILSRYMEEYPDKDIGGFHEVKIKFAFPIKISDASGSVTPVLPYSLNIDEIEYIGDIFNLAIECEDTENKVEITAHLGDWKDDDGEYQVTTLENLARISFKNCAFSQGIGAQDTSRYVLEFVNCDVKRNFEFGESRDPMPATSTNLILRNVRFSNMENFILRRLSLVSINGAIFDNPVKDDAYYDSIKNRQTQNEGFNDPDIGQFSGEETEVPPFEYISPTYEISGCKTVEISDLVVKNFFSGIDIRENRNVTLANIDGMYGQAGKQLVTTIFVHDSDEVRISNINFNGVAVDRCKKVFLSSVRCSISTCRNAEYAVRFDRISESLSISDIKPEANAVKTGIVIALSEAKINISNSEFNGIQTGISLSSVPGETTVSDCAFVNLAASIKASTVTGKLTLTDCVFNGNEKIFSAVELADLVIMDSVFDGKPDLEGIPTKERPDISLKGCVNTTIRDTKITRCAVLFNTCNNIMIRGSAMNDSILDIDGTMYVEINDFYFDAVGVSNVSEENPAFKISTAQTFKSDTLMMKGCKAFLNTCENTIITGSAFPDGLQLYNCGDEKSKISQCAFGKSDNLKAFVSGLTMELSHGFELSGNFFFADTGKVVARFGACSHLKYMHTNGYASEECIISIYDGDTNLNHFIVDKSDIELPRAKLETSSIFSELFSVVMPKIHKLGGGKIFAYTSIDQVFTLKKNIISILDVNEEWFQYYIKTVNDKLNENYKNISSK